MNSADVRVIPLFGKQVVVSGNEVLSMGETPEAALRDAGITNPNGILIYVRGHKTRVPHRMGGGTKQVPGYYTGYRVQG